MYIVRIIGNFADVYYGPFNTKEDAEKFVLNRDDRVFIHYINSPNNGG